LFPSSVTPSKFVLFPRLKTAVVDGAPNANGLLLAVENEKEPGCTAACWVDMAADWPNIVDCVD